jgi:signal transduction histidine kinase
MKNPTSNDTPNDTLHNWLTNREACEEFVAIAAHDLREPLRAIRAGSELLLANSAGDRSEAASRGAQFVEQGIERMETLVHDIAEYCYAEIRPLNLATTHMGDVLRAAQNEWGEILQANAATLTHDPLPQVKGDFLALTAVLGQLLQNACKFRGEKPPEIHVGAARQGAEWIFSVKDNGVGFSPQYRERIFRPFERLNGKQYPGSGLGLTLAKNLLEHQGGRIWAESVPGQGSIFHFSMPVAD